MVEGESIAVVEATGSRTRLAAIALLTQAGHRPRSPLAQELHRVVRTVAMIAVGVGVAFFGVALAVGSPASDGFLFAIGVTVALVPEGLLPTVTLSLAMGAQRMAARDALVRRLESVETLGSTTFICTDKTGTLTRNEMAVVEVWTPSGTVEIDSSGYDPTPELVVEAAALPRPRGPRARRGQVFELDVRWSVRGSGSRWATRWKPRSTHSLVGCGSTSPDDEVGEPCRPPVSVRPAPQAHVRRDRRAPAGQGCARRDPRSLRDDRRTRRQRSR